MEESKRSIYRGNGYVERFGKPVTPIQVFETTAVSAAKARIQFAAQVKRKMGLEMSAKLTYVGDCHKVR